MLHDTNATGPLTRSKASHLVNFCGLSSFVSITEPSKVVEAFMEPEWIQAMQDELDQFKLNNVRELVKQLDPRKHNAIGTKWIYAQVEGTRHDLQPKAMHRLNELTLMKLLHLLLDLKLFVYCLLMLIITILHCIKWM